MDRSAVLIVPGSPTDDDVMDYLLNTLSAINIQTDDQDHAVMFNVVIGVNHVNIETEQNAIDKGIS